MKRDEFGRRLSPLVKPAPSTQPAEWIGALLLPWGKGYGTRVCSVVPMGFEAYCRILNPACGPPPARAQLRWQDIARSLGHTVHAESQWETFEEMAAASGRHPPWHEPPVIGECPGEVIVPLAGQLSRCTSTPGSIYFAMWIGFAAVQSVVKVAPRFMLPHREYALLHGPIEALPAVIESPSPFRQTPSLAWPADRAWFLGTEVDFRWTYVGGTGECISQLVDDRRLEALWTMPEHRGDLESDWPPATDSP